jgi:hypothetical protein
MEKVVSFEGGPASFSDVIRDLNDGGGGSVSDPAPGPSDYSSPPPDVNKLAAANLDFFGRLNEKVAEAFAVSETELPFADPLRDAIEAREKIASLYDEATSEISSLEVELMGVCDDFYGHVKRASLHGVPLGNIVAALSTVESDPVFMKEAFEYLTPKLIENGVFPNFRTLSSSLEKTAQVGTLNPDHPLLGSYRYFCDTVTKLAATTQVRDELQEQLNQVGAFLKTAKDWVDVAEQGVRAIPKAWNKVTGIANKASGPAGELASRLGGPTAGKVVGTAVKYAPHVAAGLAAEDAYQHMKYNPVVRGTSNFVMSRVPYTEQNQIRQYQIQRGQ